MADKKYDNTNRGVLFRQEEKDSAKHPDWNGSINVKLTPEEARQAISEDGIDFWLSAWVKASQKDGRKFLSLSRGKAKGDRARVDLDDDELGGESDDDFGGGDSAPKSKPNFDDEIPF